MANYIVFALLAVVILGSAVMCVTTKRIMRAATFLLFVLFGIAGIYFLLDYIPGCSPNQHLCGRCHHDLCVCHPAGQQTHPSRNG